MFTYKVFAGPLNWFEKKLNGHKITENLFQDFTAGNFLQTHKWKLEHFNLKKKSLSPTEYAFMS